MLGLVAAALVQLPTPNLDTVRAVMRSAGSNIREPLAGVRVRAFVDEKGNVRNCAVVSFVGSQRSADVLCQAFAGKKVKPARDTDGSRIGGFIETVIVVTPTRRTASPVPPERPADARLSVQEIPDELARSSRLAIGVIIDEQGAIAACGPVSTEHEALAARGCETVAGNTFTVIHDEDGEPIRYARSLDIELTVETEAASGA